MSGYLKRMAASAAVPRGAVHPLVAGVFARETRPETGAERPEVGMLVQTPRPRESRPVEEVKERRRVAGKEEESVESRQRPSEASSSRESLVPGWRQEFPPEPGERQAMQARSDADHAREGRREESREGAEAREPRAGSEITLLVPSVHRAEADARTEQPPTSARISAVGARREDADQRRAKSDEGQRGGEEIQIHIGRIEVIAVPQTVQRAAPARPQHGETLEAYLKRHDRRSR